MSFNKFIKSSTTCTPSVLKLITNTYLGSKGAQYKLLNAEERAKNLDNPLFVFIERSEKALGNITFCNRINSDTSENYIRYFAFQEAYRAKKQAKTKQKTSYLKQAFQDIYKQDVFGKNEAFTYYAFVDQQNFKSLNMGNAFQFEQIGDFKTSIFSRLNPKSKLEIRKLNNTELLTYHQKLKDNYAEYYFFHPVNISKGTVYGYFENESLSLACTVHPTSWEILSLPGKYGKAKLKLLQKVPVLKKFFLNNKLEFLGIEGFVVDKPELINSFLESILDCSNKKIAMWWADTKCEKNKALETVLKKGILARVSQQENSKIIVKTNTNETSVMKSKPTYISAYDVS